MHTTILIGSVDKAEIVEKLNSADTVCIEILLSGGNLLVLDKNICHFVGYKPTSVISLYYSDKVTDDEYYSCNSEYFLSSQFEKAADAFEERFNAGGFDISSMSQDINTLLISDN